jgi:hypothetical protein
MRGPIYRLISPLAQDAVPTSTHPGHFNTRFGERLLTTSRAPFLDVCRILAGEGVPGETVVSMRHVDSKTIAPTATLARAAAPTVDENSRPRFMRWQAMGWRAAQRTKPRGGSVAQGRRGRRTIGGRAWHSAEGRLNDERRRRFSKNPGCVGMLTGGSNFKISAGGLVALSHC